MLYCVTNKNMTFPQKKIKPLRVLAFRHKKFNPISIQGTCTRLSSRFLALHPSPHTVTCTRLFQCSSAHIYSSSTLFYSPLLYFRSATNPLCFACVVYHRSRVPSFFNAPVHTFPRLSVCSSAYLPLCIQSTIGHMYPAFCLLHFLSHPLSPPTSFIQIF